MNFGSWFGNGPQQEQNPLYGADKMIAATLGGMQNSQQSIGQNMLDVPLSKIFAAFFAGELPEIFKETHPIGSVLNAFMRGEVGVGEADQVAWAIVGGIYRQPRMPGGWAKTPETFRGIIQSKDKTSFWMEISAALKPAEGGRAREAMMRLLHSLASGTNENARQEQQKATAAAMAAAQPKPIAG